MFEEFNDAKSFIDEHDIRMVDFHYCDLWGRPHHLTVPVSQFTPTLLERGLGIDGSSVELKSVKAGDMVIVPDLSTAALDPFWDIPTLNFLCNTLTADAREPYSDDPRTVAQRAERHLRSRGALMRAVGVRSLSSTFLILYPIKMRIIRRGIVFNLMKLNGSALRRSGDHLSLYMVVTMSHRPRINSITSGTRLP